MLRTHASRTRDTWADVTTRRTNERREKRNELEDSGIAGSGLLAVQQTADAKLLTNGSFESGVATDAYCANRGPARQGLRAGSCREVTSTTAGPACGTPQTDREASTLGFQLARNTRPTVREHRRPVIHGDLRSFREPGGSGGTDLTKIVTVGAGGTSQNFTYEVPSIASTPYPWLLKYEPQSWSFVAIAASTTISFASAAVNSASYGPVIDNVTLTAVPLSPYRSPPRHGCCCRALQASEFSGDAEAA